MKLDRTSIFVFVGFALLFLIVMLFPRKNKDKHEVATTQPIETTVSDSILMAEVNAMPAIQPTQLHHYTEADIAKFTLAAEMGQSPKIISVTKSQGLYIVAYNRPNDGQRFTYKVKIDGSRAIWANIDGRWRDRSDDGRITYSEIGKKLKITRTFSDGSSDEKLFSK